MNKIWVFLGGFVGVLLVGALLVRLLCFSFVDNYEFGYKFDMWTGKTEKLINADGTYQRGYIFKRPLVDAVNTIDLRPFQICISANSRVLNCKLVRFNPEGFETFIDWHGRADYTRENLSDIMMSYAYDKDYETNTQKYPFLYIDKGTSNKEADAKTTQVVTDSISK